MSPSDPMATNAASLRPFDRQPRTTSSVSFDVEEGVTVRRARFFEDEELASESFASCVTG